MIVVLGIGYGFLSIFGNVMGKLEGWFYGKGFMLVEFVKWWDIDCVVGGVVVFLSDDYFMILCNWFVVWYMFDDVKSFVV